MNLKTIIIVFLALIVTTAMAEESLLNEKTEVFSINYINFEDQTSCRSRAKLIGMILSNLGHSPFMATMTLSQNSEATLSPIKNPTLSWGWHAAAAILVNEEVIVFDPSVADQPVNVNEWKNLVVVNGTDATSTVGYYPIDSEGFSLGYPYTENLVGKIEDPKKVSVPTWKHSIFVQMCKDFHSPLVGKFAPTFIADEQVSILRGELFERFKSGEESVLERLDQIVDSNFNKIVARWVDELSSGADNPELSSLLNTVLKGMLFQAHPEFRNIHNNMTSNLLIVGKQLVSNGLLPTTEFPPLNVKICGP